MSNLKYIETENRKQLTIEQYFFNSLYERGMFDDDANAILTDWKTEMEKGEPSISERYGDKVEGYPPSVIGIWSIWLDSVALKWLEVNAPSHWAKSLFKKEVEMV